MARRKKKGKHQGHSLDRDVKKVESSWFKHKHVVKSKDIDKVFKDLFNAIPGETWSHLKNTNTEALLAVKSALNGVIDEAIDESDKLFKGK